MVSASSYYKPTPQKALRARAEREHATARAACRLKVWTDTGGSCARCGVPLYLKPSDEGADWYNVANIHEKIPRSLGGSDIDPANGECTCAACHTGKGYHAK